MNTNCKHLVEADRRIALYDPMNESNVFASFATLEEAQKYFIIPDDIEIEQGIGMLFIAVSPMAKRA